MRSNIYTLFTAFVSFGLTAVATPIDTDSRVLVDSYTLDIGAEVKVYSLKDTTTNVAERAPSPDSPVSNTLERIDLGGHPCSSFCDEWTTLRKPNSEDCASLIDSFINFPTGEMGVAAHSLIIVTRANCSIALVNSSPGPQVINNYGDLGAAAQQVYQECIVDENVAVGYCDYEGLGGVYTAVAHISLWG